MESLIPPILLMLIIGGVAGYFAGHLFKRVSGMSLTIGVFAFFILFLVYIGTFDVKVESITANLAKFFDIVGPLGLATLASSVPFVASFIAGIFIGYRRY
ncbi:MAG: hypothetical protein JSW14_07250 [Candidatus Bathyarchaeum sp.]|nr:MAG: hypothetical protein JSW14_07250 [Candidatus Bathyarchaeum sp.]